MIYELLIVDKVLNVRKRDVTFKDIVMYFIVTWLVGNGGIVCSGNYFKVNFKGFNRWLSFSINAVSIGVGFNIFVIN